MNVLSPRAGWRRAVFLAPLLLFSAFRAEADQPYVSAPSALGRSAFAPIEFRPGIPVARLSDAPAVALMTGDLDALRRFGRLRVLTPESTEVRYGDAPSDQLGRLLNELSQRLGMPVERIAVRTREEMLRRLAIGAGDLIVGLDSPGLADHMPDGVRASVPLTRYRFQVVTARHSPLARLRGLEAAFGRRLTLAPDSPLWHRVDALVRDHPWVKFEAAPLHLGVTAMAGEVARGDRDALVLASHDAERVLALRDDLVVAFEIGAAISRHWYVRAGNEHLLSEIDAFLGQSHLAHRPADHYRGDLPEIRRHGVLRAIVRPRSGSFAMVDGQPEGFDFRLLQRLSQRLGLTLRTEVAQSDAEALRWLDEGRGDLIAAPATPLSNDRFLRTLPHWYTAPVVVAPIWVNVETPDDLSGRHCLMPPDSPLKSAVEGLLARGDADFELEFDQAYAAAEGLRAALLAAPRAFTVLDAATARRLLEESPDLAVSLSLHDATNHRWVTRAGDLELAGEVNRMVREFWGDPEQTRLATQFQTGANRDAMAVRRLSPYDDLARATAGSHGFDWRLIVAMMFEESGFDPDARSPAGALGLMQVLPKTAATVGVRNLRHPDSGILAGVRYLDQLRDQFESEIPVTDRTWFAVASYHAGASRVVRARERAAELGLDPDRWFGHVERAMLALAEETRSAGRKGMYRHTVTYVREVRTRFDTYVQATAPELALRAGPDGVAKTPGKGS